MTSQSDQPEQHEPEQEEEGRDVRAEVLAVIEAETAHGDFKVSDVARQVVDKLRATDPELLLEFLDAEAVALVAHLIRRVEHLAKMKVRRGAGLTATQPRRSVFAETMADHDAELESDAEPAAAPAWLDRQYLTADGLRRHLRDCTAEDLKHNVGLYLDRAQANQYEAAFLAAIAKKLDGRKVGDVFTDAQLAAMRG